MTKHLIIIPGIGDDHPVYHKGVRMFSMFGYAPQVHIFGWNSADPSSYDARLQQLNSFVDTLEGEIYLIGVSAGGSVAANCLATMPNKVTKVATLCSPLAAFSSRVNPLLAVSIEETERHLAEMPAETKNRILSLHALYDPIVATHLSKPLGVKSVTLPTILHGATIFLGLTIFSTRINHFFKQR